MLFARRSAHTPATVGGSGVSGSNLPRPPSLQKLQMAANGSRQGSFTNQAVQAPSKEAPNSSGPVSESMDSGVVVKKVGPEVLVGDIGGTNARLSLWLTGGSCQEIFAEKYPTAQYPTFEDVVEKFLSNPAVSKHAVQAACLAIAGAVEDNRCEMTNLNWIVDGEALEKRFGFGVALLNDFEAVGYGIPALGPNDIIAVNDVPVKPKAPKVVMGPGTGLGEAQLMWDNSINDYKVWPGEGAHATFAPRGWKQKALAQFITYKLKHCEIEEVACGKGLETIYEFLMSDVVANRPDVLKNARKKQVAEITSSALDGSDPLAVEAVDMFLSIIGTEAGAMALRCLAKGGVYIAGGVMPRLMKRVQAGSLMEGFLMRDGREKFHQILAATPLFVITNDKVGQIGAREYAMKMAHITRPHHP